MYIHTRIASFFRTKVEPKVHPPKFQVWDICPGLDAQLPATAALRADRSNPKRRMNISQVVPAVGVRQVSDIHVVPPTGRVVMDSACMFGCPKNKMTLFLCLL